MRYFITGTPGSGKTTIGKLLEEKGYAFGDSDHIPGLADWYNSKTGILAQKQGKANAEWYSQHSWNWDREQLVRFLQKFKNKTIFLCGMTTNQTNDLDLFDKVFLLKTKGDILRNRMLTRRDDPDVESIDGVLDWHDSFENEMIKHGAVSVDASQEPEDVVNEILENIRTTELVPSTISGELREDS